MMRMMWIYVLVVGGIAVAPWADAADESKKPTDGGSRVLRLFPQEGLQHLPDAMLQHGATNALPSVSKDPRSLKANPPVGVEQPQ